MEIITPVTIEHWDRLELGLADKVRFEADPEARRRIHALFSFGTGCMMEHEGLIIGLAGWFEMWPGVLEVWAFPSVHVERYAMMYLRMAKRYLRSVREVIPHHRIQTNALADKTHDRWMNFLGFHCEGTMRAHSSSKQDYRMWSIIEEDF